MYSALKVWSILLITMNNCELLRVTVSSANTTTVNCYRPPTLSNPKVNVVCHAGTQFVKGGGSLFCQDAHLFCQRLSHHQFRYTHRNFSKLWVHILTGGFILQTSWTLLNIIYNSITARNRDFSEYHYSEKPLFSLFSASNICIKIYVYIST